MYCWTEILTIKLTGPLRLDRLVKSNGRDCIYVVHVWTSYLFKFKQKALTFNTENNKKLLSPKGIGLDTYVDSLCFYKSNSWSVLDPVKTTKKNSLSPLVQQIHVLSDHHNHKQGLELKKKTIQINMFHTKLIIY